ncbi:rhomboid family intramembrane serine protease [Marinilabiliaceae bacterium JC017]|nr:rhomboid family intramembrane serine protease [Marinilabiliaceae bacterium JC017]
MNYRPSFLGNLPPVVKNLLIINALFFLATMVLKSTFGINLNDLLGLHVIGAKKFNPSQFITYMFLHADLTHVFFNMFAVFMFGRVLETVWGPKRFLIYYLVTGIGAAGIHMATLYIDIVPFQNALDAYMSNASHENLVGFMNEYVRPATYDMARNIDGFLKSYDQLRLVDPERALGLSKEFLNQFEVDYLNAHVTIGASGSVFGILLAFGMLFPNTELMLLFPPIPIKAKYFVIIYGVIELFMGIGNFAYDNVAHWAHLGGMLFGFILIRYWRKKGVF